MRPDASPSACWTSFVGAPMHDLGALPEKCLTCAAKQREDTSGCCYQRAGGCESHREVRDDAAMTETT